jgi:hypothetical protein
MLGRKPDHVRDRIDLSKKAIRFRGQFFQNEFARRAAFLFLRVKLGPWGEL